MTSQPSTCPPRFRRLRFAIGGVVLGLAVSLSGSMTTAAPTPSPSPEASLMQQLPGDEETMLVVGATAITVLGLTGLALLDRRPERPDHEVDPVDDEPES